MSASRPARRPCVCSDPDLREVRRHREGHRRSWMPPASPMTSTPRSSPTPPSRTSRTASRLSRLSGADMHHRHRRRLLHGHLPRASASSSTNPEFADVVSLEGVADTKKHCLPSSSPFPPPPAPLPRSPSTTSSPTRRRTASSSASTSTTSPTSPSSTLR